MKFEVEMEIEVAEPDADVMAIFANAVSDRFVGTAIKVRSISIMPARAAFSRYVRYGGIRRPPSQAEIYPDTWLSDAKAMIEDGASREEVAASMGVPLDVLTKALEEES